MRNVLFVGRRSRRMKVDTRSRSGAMLLLVLIVMAVGLILITSALALTFATREDYYTQSEASQARLTATSTAKTVVDAVLNSDITDADLEALADNVDTYGVKGTTLLASSATGGADTSSQSLSNSVSPGLSGSTGVSYTSVRVYNYNDTVIAIEVKTALNALGGATAETETVTAFLQYNKPVVTDGAFDNVVLAGGEGSTIEVGQTIIGYLESGVTGKTNTAVLHGNVTLATSQSLVTSTLILDGKSTIGGNTVYAHDVIYYGDDAGIVLPSSGTITLNANLYFIRNTANTKMFFDTAGNQITATGAGGWTVNGAVYLENTALNSANWDILTATSGIMVCDGSSYTNPAADSDITTNVYVGTNGSTVTYGNNGGTATVTNTTSGNSSTVTALIASLKANATTYRAKIEGASATGLRQVLTTAEATSSFAGGIDTLSEVQASGATCIDSDLYGTSGTKTYTAGNYYINISNKNVIGSSGYADTDVRVLQFDLSGGSITIYVCGSGTLNIQNGLIKFINGTDSFTGKIILLPSVKVNIEPNNRSVDTGIIGTSHDAYLAGKEIAGKTGVRACTFTLSNGATKTYYVDYTKNSKPFLYVIGLGDNSITASRYSTLEGYVGLYGNPGVTSSDLPGSITFNNAPYFYGRFEAYTFSSSSDDSFIPYCPSPGETDTGTKTPVVTNYSVIGYKTSST